MRNNHRVRMRTLTRLLVGLVVSSWLAGSAEERLVVAAEAVNPETPEFEMVTLTGEALGKASLKGRPALLVFWAPWCRVCQRELPLLGQFYLHEKPAQLRIISIGFADTRGNVEAFVKARSGVFVFPTAYDEDRWVAQAFKINATPTYVLMDAQGAIVLVHRGGGVLQNVQFRKFLSRLRG
jgi:thiol-disulfide isomerase/thioredoxin